MRFIRPYKIFEKDSELYFHCSNDKFEKFDMSDNKTYKEFDIPSWFFTQDLEYARRYGKYLYTVQLDLGKCFDTEDPKHMKMFKDYLKEQEIDPEPIFDEQFFMGRPYWTCADAFYAARSNGFDSILIQEELEKEVLSVAVFSLDQIEIIDVK